MVQRRALMFLVVVAVAAGLWLLLRTERVPSPVRPQAPPALTSAASPAVAEPVEVTRDEAPVAAAPASPEFGRDEWSALQRPLAAGELEAIVLRGRRPLAGVRVRVWGRAPGRLGTAGDRGQPVHEGRTDADGRVHFGQVAAGDFVLRADHDGRYVDAPGRVVAVDEPSSGARTVVLPFSSASIVGSVRDDSGGPRAGEVVHVVCTQPACTVVTVTDASGSFEVSGLCGGRYWVQLERPHDAWSAANERMLTLRAGEHARMDFGGPTPAGSLRGRVVDGEGGVLRGERTLRVRNVVHNDERLARTDSNGEFTLPLPPGRWEVLVSDGWASNALAVADIDLGEVRVDVPWPGIRLLVVVSATPDVDLQDVARYLSLRGAGRADLTFTDAGQSFVQWSGLEPGDYALQGGPGFHFIDAPHTVPVHLSSAPVQRVLINVRR